MNTCDYGHDDIAYNSNKCPMCEMMKKVDSLEEQVMDLQDEIADLNTKSAEYLNEHQEKPTITNGEN